VALRLAVAEAQPVVAARETPLCPAHPWWLDIQLAQCFAVTQPSPDSSRPSSHSDPAGRD